MAGRMISAVIALSLASAMTGRASAQPTAGAPATDVALSTAGKAARRFPQPVRTGDLAGRRLLAPEESQPVLGRVVGVSRGQNGLLDLVVRTGGVFGFGGRLVAVPLDAIGLLGEHVALLDLTPAQLSALPSLPEPADLVPDETIRVGLVKPFH